MVVHTLTIAVFVLNDHVFVFHPRRVVTYHVGVMTQHRVSVNFMQS